MMLDTALGQWVDARVARREINGLTASSYRRSLNNFAEYIGQRQVMEVTTEDFERWLAAQNVAGTTLNTRAAPVRAFFGWAALRGLLPGDPTLGVQRAKTPTPFPRRLSNETITKLLVVADFRATVLIMLGLHLGLRCCEMSRLTIEAWDREQRTIDINGKGAKWRTLPVSGEVETALDLWISGLDVKRGPVFPSQRDSTFPIKPNRVSMIVTHTASVAQVKATAHRLRHTFGWTMVEAGVPIPVVKQLMGHESLSTTTVYTVPGEEDLRAHMGKFQYLGRE